MRIDFEKIQTAANQVGVVIIAGGLVQGFFGHVGAIPIGSLIGVGILLILTSSLQNESSIMGCYSRCCSVDDYYAYRFVS